MVGRPRYVCLGIVAIICQAWMPQHVHACYSHSLAYPYVTYNKTAEIVVRARPTKLEPVYGRLEGFGPKVRLIAALLSVEVDETLRGKHQPTWTFVWPLEFGLGGIPETLDDLPLHLADYDRKRAVTERSFIIGGRFAKMLAPIIVRPACDFAFVLPDDEFHLVELRLAGVIPGRAND